MLHMIPKQNMLLMVSLFPVMERR